MTFLSARPVWGMAKGKSYNLGGGSFLCSFLLQEWTLDAWYDGQNDHIMGSRGSKMTFFRPAYHRDSEPKLCIFGVSIPWRKGQGRTAGNERERDRVRERERERERYPGFQKRDAHALRFGSMNPISRVSGPGSKVGRCKGSNPALYLGKSYNLGGGTYCLLIVLYCRNEIKLHTRRAKTSLVWGMRGRK